MSPTHAIQKIEDLECYLVGGAVRDQILRLDQYDRDWVVVGASPEIMLSLGFKRVGSKFPVFLHPKTHDEYALARREQKSGVGYKGFAVDCSSDVSLEEDLVRRDLTVNAMARKSDGTLIDPYDGLSDLKIVLCDTSPNILSTIHFAYFASQDLLHATIRKDFRFTLQPWNNEIYCRIWRITLFDC